MDYLHSDELLQASRLSPSAFLRKRRLPFPVLVAAMLAGFKASVQNELNAFFAHLANQADLVRAVSAQAFSKARRNFPHLAFARLNAHLMTLVEAHLAPPRWHGLRVVAADASKLRLILADATGGSVREAIAFALHLPGQELTLAAELYSPQVGERQTLFEHLDTLAPSDLLVLDRGYPARWLVAHLAQKGQPFCMRVDDSGFVAVRDFLRSGQAEAVVAITPPNLLPSPDRSIPSLIGNTSTNQLVDGQVERIALDPHTAL